MLSSHDCLAGRGVGGEVQRLVHGRAVGLDLAAAGADLEALWARQGCIAVAAAVGEKFGDVES